MAEGPRVFDVIGGILSLLAAATCTTSTSCSPTAASNFVAHFVALRAGQKR